MSTYEWLLPWVARRRLRQWDAYELARTRALTEAYRYTHKASELVEQGRPITARFVLSCVDDSLRKAIVPTVDDIREHL